MKPVRYALASVAGIMLLLAAGSICNVYAQIDLGPGRLTGSAEVGVMPGDVPDSDTGTSRTYHDMAQRVIVPELKWFFGDHEQRYYADFYGLNIGQTNEIYNLRAGIYGLLDIQAQWEEIPHFFSDDQARTPYIRDGGNFTLNSFPPPPTPGQPPGANVHTWLDQHANFHDMSLLWGLANLNVRYTPTPWLTYSLYYNFINPSGERAYGTLFGSPGTLVETELFEPLEYDIHNYGVGVEYADGRWFLGLKYDGSFFINQFETLTWQNPDVWGERTGPGGACVDNATFNPSLGLGPCRGRRSSFPDNESHIFTLEGGVNLPYNTRVMGSVSDGWWLQNTPFIPYTINSALPQPALPRRDLGGDVEPAFVNGTIVSNPIEPLQLKAIYTFFNYKNDTSRVPLVTTAINDTRGPFTALTEPWSFSDQNVKLEARYKLMRGLFAGVVGNIETLHNSGLEVLQQNRTSYGPVIDWSPVDWLLFRGSYEHAFRSDPGYNNNRLTEVQNFAGEADLRVRRRFDEAELELNQFTLYTQAQPFEADELSPFRTLTLYAEMDYDDYFYPDTAIGLQHWSDYCPSVGLTYELGPVTMFANWGWQANDWRLRDFQGTGTIREPNQAPGRVWDSFDRGQGSSVDVGFDLTIPENMILPNPSNFSVRYTYADSTDAIHTHGDAVGLPPTGAVSFPTAGTQFHELIVRYRYLVTRRITLDFGYYFSHFGERDFGFDNLTPWMPPTPGSATQWSAFLAETAWLPYDANAGFIAIKYRF